MSEITTTEPVNLYQLGQEIGGSPSFRVVGPYADGRTVIRSDVAQDVLKAAVASHVADPAVQPPASDPEPDPLEVLQAKVAAVEALATKANVTAQEVATAMRDARPKGTA